MTDLDELADLMYDAGLGDEPDSDRLTNAANAIIAAGYRKPRTITTVEELDALPHGTIIRAGEARFKNRVIGRIFERSFGRDSWLELDPGDRNDGEETWQGEWLIRFFTAGITVIYEPED